MRLIKKLYYNFLEKSLQRLTKAKAYNSVGKSMRLISAKSVVQVYLSLRKCGTFSLRVKRTAHNGNDVGSNPIQFIYFIV